MRRSHRASLPPGPIAAAQDAALYALLALTDALRLGRLREVKLACQLLEQQLLVPTFSPALHA